MNDNHIAGPVAAGYPVQAPGFPVVGIWRDGADGGRLLSLQDELLTHRIILVNGPITSELASQVVELIEILGKGGASDARAPIELHITSDGGSVAAGLAIVDAMQRSPCPVHTYCPEHAYSMGAVVFAMGRVRRLAAHAELLIHDPLITWASGNALTIRDMSERLMRVRDVLADLICARTGLPKGQVLDLTSRDSFLSRGEAIRLNFADDV